MSAGTRSGRSRRPTIADVAREAGVSTGAVSLAMNGRAGVAAATAERIRATADELGWRPSATARGLTSARAQAIGIVVRRPAAAFGNDPFFSAIIGGIETVLAPHDYALLIRIVNDEEQETAAYQTLAGAGRIDGFLLTDIRVRDPRLLLVQQLGAPSVLVGRPTSGCDLPSVGPDDRGPVLRTVQHLVELGHRRIGHVRGAHGYIHTADRELAWRDGLAAAGLSDDLLADGDFTPAGGADATRELLAAPDPPTAIVYASDLMAIAGMAAAGELGLRVPDDLSVTGFDDIDLAAHVAAPLTTVSRDMLDWGQHCATALMAQLDGSAVPRHTPLPAQLVIRESTSRPRLSRPGPARPTRS
ncbi:MAG: LacI family DNA-binding transcriptional regulator [Mycobacteriales bacterium]